MGTLQGAPLCLRGAGRTWAFLRRNLSQPRVPPAPPGHGTCRLGCQAPPLRWATSPHPAFPGETKLTSFNALQTKAGRLNSSGNQGGGEAGGRAVAPGNQAPHPIPGPITPGSPQAQGVPPHHILGSCVRVRTPCLLRQPRPPPVTWKPFSEIFPEESSPFLLPRTLPVFLSLHL